MKKGDNHLTRRELLKGAAGMGMAGAVSPIAGLAGYNPQKKGLIAEENKKAGTTDWQLTYVKSNNYRSALIEGYCSKTSLRAGESLDIFLSAGGLSGEKGFKTDVTIDFYRIGYYGGKGGRFMQRIGPFSVHTRSTPPIAEHRLRTCTWLPSASFTIPGEWVSGVYVGKLSCTAHRYQSYIIFVVRDDRQADIMFQTSDTTWQAYNKWPDEYSLYDSDSPLQPHSSRTWVSFDRPYGKYPQVVDQPLSQGSGEFLLWEYPLCYWLEQQGYDVTYCSNIDTHSDRQGLDRVKCFFSVGHDEYWTLPMFENVRSAVDSGLNAAFLSGNAIMWVIDLKPGVDIDPSLVDGPSGLALAGGRRIPAIPDSKDRLNRTMYRIGRFGGETETEKALGIMGPFERKEWPNENILIGARTMYPFNGSADWIVSKPDHWIFEGTGMKKGDKIPGLVGWEHHGDPAAIPGLEVIAEGATINSGGEESYYTATVYPGVKGNWVFNAATIYWPLGLSDPPGHTLPKSHFGGPHGADERVQRITANFLKRCGITVKK
jgi:hypothetical protein